MTATTTVNGTVTGPPERETTTTGLAKTEFELVSTGPGGKGRTWFTIQLLGKMSGQYGPHIYKGRHLIVNGAQTQRKYFGRDGLEKYRVTITASQVTVLNEQPIEIDAVSYAPPVSANTHN